METPSQNQNEQQRATKGIFHCQFHSFSSVLDQWKVADIKSHKKTRKSKNRLRKAMKSNKEQQKTKTNIVVEEPNQAIKKPKRATKGKETRNV